MIIGALGVFTCHAESHRPQVFLDEIAGAPDEGAQIVSHFCSSCHADTPLIDLGAPRPQNEGDWKPRLEQGLEALFKRADEGFNAMPPRGGCFECTDDQLRAAIKSMTPEIKHKESTKIKKIKNNTESAK
jgi:cytochrome c5